MADDRGCSLGAVGLAFVTGGLAGAAWHVATVSKDAVFALVLRLGSHRGFPQPPARVTAGWPW